MIIGVGTDIVEIARIEKLLKKSGNKFIDRILTDSEKLIAPARKESFFPNVIKRSRIHLLNNRRVEVKDNKFISYLAKRWAAKEAISKALGTGIGSKLSFKDIEISKDSEGKPLASIKGRSDITIHLSISDELKYATAFAVIEK